MLDFTTHHPSPITHHQTYGELYRLLNRRRDDPEFWPPLATLLRGVVRGAVDPDRPGRLPAPQAELLASWDVDQLLEDLRAALPGGQQAGDPSAVRRFAARLSSAVMGGFLLLGLASASGCSATPKAKRSATAKSTSEPARGSKAKARPTPESWFNKCDLKKSSVFWGTINKSSLHDKKKQQLCSCFDALNKDWADSLTRLFSYGSPEEIARSLEYMLTCCDPTNKQCLEQGYDVAKSNFIREEDRFAPVPVYKGVSFPEK